MMYIKTNELYHYGMPRRSGRYPWGSGDRPYQGDFDVQKRHQMLNEGRNRLIAEQDRKAAGGGSSLTPAQKAKMKKIAFAAAAAVGISAAVYISYRSHAVDRLDDAVKSGASYSQMKDVLSKSFSETGAVLKSGDVVHRMVGFKDFDIDKAGNNLFVSGSEKDRVMYANFLKDFNGTGERYDVALKVTKDIKIPSRQQAEKIFEDLYKGDPQYRQQLIDTMAEIYKVGNQLTDREAKALAKFDVRTDRFKAAVTGIAKNTAGTQKFVNELKKNGFDAIADYHDIMDQIADTPLIVFDPQQTLSKVGEEFVNKKYRVAGLKGLADNGVTTLIGLPVKQLLTAVKLGLA